MSEIAFEKWEGLGNDFVIVDRTLDVGVVRKMCDRRRGIGADGVLVVGGGERPSMTVYNADGSRPEMCGNGLRCVAAHLVTSGFAKTFVVATDAGDRSCVVERTGDDAIVEVDMGTARLDPAIELDVDGRRHAFAQANLGNPHAVTFAPVSSADHERIGSSVERAVPGGINVEFVRQDGARFEVVVWERGVGFTQACGTGACAVAAIACVEGRAQFGESVTVRLPGGDLGIVVGQGDRAGATGRIRMTGPARRVFRGTWGG